MSRPHPRQVTRTPAARADSEDRNDVRREVRLRYEFVVAARLSEAAVAAFPELTVSDRPGTGTTLYGPVLDRAELDGLVARFSDLGLDLVTMHRLPD